MLAHAILGDEYDDESEDDEHHDDELGEFLNGPSNGLHEQMHSHIGCICVFFHQSDFSNVATNCSLSRVIMSMVLMKQLERVADPRDG